MGESKLRRLSPRACAIGILVGLALFLIGAQLPYDDGCIPRFSCRPRSLIDLTGDRYSSHDAWHVSMWLARVAPALLAAGLIHRGAANARRATGFVAFFGIILVAFYLRDAAPRLLAGIWEPGASLWPLGAILMTISAILARRRVVVDSEREAPSGRSWLVLVVVGIALSGLGVWIGSDPAAYLFTLGMITMATGLLLMRDSGRDRPTHARWAIVPLLLGSGVLAVSYFAAWGRAESPYLLIRPDYVFDVRHHDPWEVIVALSLIAGAVMASLHLLARGAPNSFLIGGALVGPYFVVAALAPVLAKQGFSQLAPGVQLAGPGAALMLIGVFYAALRDDPLRQRDRSAGTTIQPAGRTP